MNIQNNNDNILIPPIWNKNFKNFPGVVGLMLVMLTLGIIAPG